MTVVNLKLVGDGKVGGDDECMREQLKEETAVIQSGYGPPSITSVDFSMISPLSYTHTHTL